MWKACASSISALTAALAFWALACLPIPGQGSEAPRKALKLEDPGPLADVAPGIQTIAVGPEIDRALESRDYARAEQLLIDEIEEDPRPKLLISLGRVFFLDRKYLNAAIAFQKAEGLAPLDRSSRFNLAMAYILLGKNDWARGEMEKLISEAPQEPLYPYWLGRMDYDAQHFERAIERFGRVLEIDADFVRAYDAIGLCYEALADYEQAGRYYESAVRLNRKQATPSPWPPLNYGTMLLMLDRLGEAEKLLREAVRCDEALSRSHYRLGTLLEKRELHEEASHEFLRASELDPSYPDPLYALARVYRRTGNLKAAKQALDTFRSLKDEQQ